MRCANLTLLLVFLFGLPGAAIAAGAARPAARAKVAPPRNGPVEMYTLNTHEVLMLRLRDDKGRPLKGVQKRFDHLLRCHHTNVQHAMSPRLVRVLYQVGRHFPGHRLEIVSGFRHPSVAKNPHSPHMKGLACDFRVTGVRNGDLRDYLRRDFQKVGVGYYPNSSFVHLDVRKDKSAFWIDYSGPGDRAVYSENPASDLKTGRADAYKPTKIDEGWIRESDSSPPEDGDEDGDDAGDDAPNSGAAAGTLAPSVANPAPPFAPPAAAPLAPSPVSSD